MHHSFFSKIFKLATVALFFLCHLHAFAQKEQDVVDYIEQYKNLAIAEQIRSGVPASITLAQGIHESAAGKSDLATRGNNHFGIKCKSTWTGDTLLHDDDAKQECFRKYPSSEQSYVDHSNFLKGSTRYSALFTLEITDYIGWASGLKKAGYATNPLYVRKLTELVEKYNLQQYTYDAIQLAKTGTSPGEVIPELDANTTESNPSNTGNSQSSTLFSESNKTEQKNNEPEASKPNSISTDNIETYKGLKGIWVKKGQSLVDLAVNHNLRYAKLLEMNDLPDAPLHKDMFIFLEPKRKMGTIEFHTVKEGETMQFISQKEAIKLETLYHFNNMKPGQEPDTGELLSLQYKAYGTPKLKNNINKTNTSTVVKVIQKETETLPANENNSSNESQLITKSNTSNTESTHIINAEKARKTEALLSSEKIIAVNDLRKNEAKIQDEKLVKVSYGAPKKEQIKVEQSPLSEVKETLVPVEENKEEIVTVVEPAKREPIRIEREYNETHVSDSVKSLKRRFDQAVYQPLPERKKALPASTPKPETKKTETASTPTNNTPTPKATTPAASQSDSSKKTIKPEVNTNTKSTNNKANNNNSKPSVETKKTNTTKPETKNQSTKSKANTTPTKKTTDTKKAIDTKKPSPKKK